MNRKVCNFLGLCKKAGKLSLGFDQVLQAIKEKKSSLILVTSDLASNSLKKINAQANAAGLELMPISETMDDIYNVLKKRCGIISIDDIGFSNGIKKLVSKDFEEEHNI